MVVGLVLQDLVGAEELLEQDDPRELVGQRHRPEREPVVRALELEPERPADDEAEVAPAHPAVLEEPTQRDAVERLAALVEQRDERAIGEAALDALVLTHLDQVQWRVPREELRVVGDVVGERRAHPAHGHDDDPHRCDTRARWRTNPSPPSAGSTSTSSPRTWRGRTRTSRAPPPPPTRLPPPPPGATPPGRRTRGPRAPRR